MSNELHPELSSYGSPAYDAGGLSYEGRGAAVGPDLAGEEDEAGMEIPDPNVDAEWKTILGERENYRVTILLSDNL